MATHGRGGLAALVLGSVASAVIKQATVPVVLLRPPSVGYADAPPVGCASIPMHVMAILPGQKKGIVLLMNADHFLMSNTALLEVGTGAARLLAGAQPDSIWVGIVPWMLRGLLLLPAFQIIGVAFTLLRLRRWRRDPNSRPSRRRIPVRCPRRRKNDRTAL